MSEIFEITQYIVEVLKGIMYLVVSLTALFTAKTASEELGPWRKQIIGKKKIDVAIEFRRRTINLVEGILILTAPNHTSSKLEKFTYTGLYEERMSEGVSDRIKKFLDYRGDFLSHFGFEHEHLFEKVLVGISRVAGAARQLDQFQKDRPLDPSGKTTRQNCFDLFWGVDKTWLEDLQKEIDTITKPWLLD